MIRELKEKLYAKDVQKHEEASLGYLAKKRREELDVMSR